MIYRNGINTLYLPGLVPEWRRNDTARFIEADLRVREAKLKEKYENGASDDGSNGTRGLIHVQTLLADVLRIDASDNPQTSCSFKFFGQVHPSRVPLHLLTELESEMDTPTGISTVRPPEMKFTGVLVSKNCGILYEFPDIEGLK
jgi:transmembrane E3 ubiquitin-protein ligase